MVPMTRPPTVVLEQLRLRDGLAGEDTASLSAEDSAAVVALEVATQDRPLALATLLREAQVDGIVLLARHGGPTGAVVGFASARLLHDEVHVIRMAVDDAHRRQGIATCLLDALLGWADGVGAVAVLLEVRAGNDAARSLYAAAGFAADGLRPRYYPDGEDALLLRREPAVGPSDRPAGGS